MDQNLIERPPLKLRHYGKQLHPNRFMHPNSPLHRQQQEALTSLVDWFSRDSDKKDYTAVVVMPTGTGKSGVIACLPYTLGWAIEEGKIAESDIDLHKPILVIAPGMDILHQLEQDLKCVPLLVKRGLITQDEVNKKILYSTHVLKKASDVQNLDLFAANFEIIVSNSQKWHKDKYGTPNFQELPDDMFSVVIVDEAHHLPSPQWLEIILKFHPHAKIIFFTATPERADGIKIQEHKRLFTTGCTYELNREEAIRDRLIREIDFYSGYLKFQDDLANAYPKYYYEEVLKKVKMFIDEKNEHCPLPNGIKHSAIIIAQYKDDAKEIAEICKELNFNSIKNVNTDTVPPKLKQNVWMT